jgi:hypothetical protein
MDAAGSSASATRTLAIPFALGAPDRKPASLPGVERILAGLLAPVGSSPQRPSPAAGIAMTQAV